MSSRPEQPTPGGLKRSHEEMRDALAAAEARAEAADARAADERIARESADARAADERIAREAADAAAEGASKQAFFIQMRSISTSSSAETASNVDEARRDAPAPTIDGAADFLADFPDDGDAATCFARFRQRHANAWQPQPQPQRTAALKENRDVHPIVECALRAAAPLSLRVWHDRVAADCIASAHIRPDFVLTLDRDAGASTIGAILVVEVKLPGGINAAARQVRAYLRRRIYKLSCEADARGEAFDDVFAYGAATDGMQVVLVRVASGGPPAGTSFRSLALPHKPCPARQTPPLPLFGPWDFRSPPPWLAADAAAPVGFCALVRLCAQPTLLGGSGLLASLRVALRDINAAATGDAELPREETLELGKRLGCGGTSDVYECVSRGGSGAGGSGGAGNGGSGGGGSGGVGDCVLKVARIATAAVAAGFDAERKALFALRDAAAKGLVPECVAIGERVRAASSLALAPAGTAPWRVLLLRPCGTPLDAWVAARVEAAEAAAASAAAGGASAAAGDASGDKGDGGSESARAAAAAARRACADAVLHRVLDALTDAHAVGWVHCDVRPANVVVVGDSERGAPMLVDWGIARLENSSLLRCGVAAFADARMWRASSSVGAGPQHDALAALYTWLAVAFGDRCAAPWVGEATLELEDLFKARREWIVERAAIDEGVRHVAEGIEKIEGSGGGSASGALDIARHCFK